MKYKTLISLRFKTHTVNEQDECVPPAVQDEFKIFSLDGETMEELQEKYNKLLEKVQKWLQ